MENHEHSVDESVLTPDPQSHLKPWQFRQGGSASLMFPWPSFNVKLPPEVFKILDELINQTHHDTKELVIKSLLLYKTAVDAEAAGKKMVILDADGDDYQEVTGF